MLLQIFAAFGSAFSMAFSIDYSIFSQFSTTSTENSQIPRAESLHFSIFKILSGEYVLFLAWFFSRFTFGIYNGYMETIIIFKIRHHSYKFLFNPFPIGSLEVHTWAWMRRSLPSRRHIDS